MKILNALDSTKLTNTTDTVSANVTIDSLGNLVEGADVTIDSLGNLVEGADVTIDSLGNLFIETEVVTITQPKAEDIFGSTSTISTPKIVSKHNEQPWTDNMAFQSISLLLFVLYFFIVHRNIEEIYTLFSNISLSKSSNHTIFSPKNRYRHTRFLSTTLFIGIIFLALHSVKYTETISLQQQINGVSDEIISLLVPIIMVIAAIIITYQLIILHTIAWITLSKDFVTQLIILKLELFSTLTIICSPILLLYVLSPEEKGVIWHYIIFVFIILAAIWFLLKSIKLFISKKIPILQWFLYLCCVELIPISCVAIIVVRY